jgi:hypothetical protein
MHTPNKGTVGPSSKTVCNDIPESWGVPIKGNAKHKYSFHLFLFWSHLTLILHSKDNALSKN